MLYALGSEVVYINYAVVVNKDPLFEVLKEPLVRYSRLEKWAPREFDGYTI